MDIPIINYNDFKFDFEKFIQEGTKLAKKTKSIKILIPLELDSNIEEKAIEAFKKKGIKTLNFEPEIVFFSKKEGIPISSGLNLIASFKDDLIEIVLMRSSIIKLSKVINDPDEKLFIKEIEEIIKDNRDILEKGMVILGNKYDNLAKKIGITIINI